MVILRDLPSRFQDAEVFVDDRGRAVRPERAYRSFKKAAKRAGLVGADSLRFHDLRHSCGSEMVQQGVSLYIVQRVLGHKTPRMTQRYAHLRDDVLADAVATLGGTGVAQNS